MPIKCYLILYSRIDSTFKAVINQFDLFSGLDKTFQTLLVVFFQAGQGTV